MVGPGAPSCSAVPGRSSCIHATSCQLPCFHTTRRYKAGVLEPEGSMETVAGLVGLGDAGEGLPVGALGESTQQLTKKFASCAGAVMGDVDIPVSVARWKAARRFKGCPCAKPMI